MHNVWPCTHSDKVRHGDGQPHSQRPGPLQVGPLCIAGREHGEDEHERDHHLDDESRSRRHFRMEHVDAERPAVLLRGDDLRDARRRQSPSALRQHVDEGAGEADPTGEEHRQGDGGVDVGAAHVRQTPEDRRDGQTGSER